MHLRSRSLLFALLLVVTPLLACKRMQEKAAEKAAEKVVESQTGGKVDLTADGGVTFKDDKGNVYQTGGGAKLPADWPSDVPAYPGATILIAAGTPAGKVVSMETTDDPTKVFEFYKSKLSGYKKDAEMDMGEGKMLSMSKDKTTVTVTVGKSGDKTTVSLTVSPKAG